MKFNQWTYGLVAVGAVSLVSVARADEAKMSQLNTALSNTTISGYVDVAAQYNNGQRDGSALNNNSGNDGFSVNSITLTLDKPLDEGSWASGYHVDLNAGNDQIDATGADATTSHLAIRQAYVALRTPVGNGIDWKLGAFDTILGYESNTRYLNPNYTHSLGYATEPTSYIGLLGTYKVCDTLTVNAGIANFHPNNVVPGARFGFASKTFLGSAVLTAPESFGLFKGAQLTLATAQAFQSGAQNNYYVGLTLPTPIKALAVGLAFDALQNLGQPNGGSWNTFGVYASYQATDKLGLALRAEYQDRGNIQNDGGANNAEITATLSYNLWANVVSRVEARWAHNEHGGIGNGGVNVPPSAGYENDLMLALNVVYKF